MHRLQTVSVAFLILLMLGGAVTIILDSWLVFTALVLTASARLVYGWAVRRQNQ